MSVFHNFATDWAGWVLHSGWQATLVAGLIFILLAASRRRVSSQLRYAALLIVLVKFATPPFWDLPTGLFSQSEAIRTPIDVGDGELLVVAAPVTGMVSESPASTLAAENASEDVDGQIDLVTETAQQTPRSHATRLSASNAQSIPWLEVLLMVHLLGTICLCIRVCRGYAAVQGIIRRSEVSNDVALLHETARIADRLKMKSAPAVRISDEADGPFATGAFRPTIVLPRELVEQLQTDQLSIVIAHELAHVRRQDLLIGWVETLLSLVWWIHPAMWWLKKSLRQTREDCCDDVLLANDLARPDRYCQTLIDAAVRQSARMAEPIVLGFTEREHPTARRMRRLMDASVFRSKHLRWPAVAVTLVLGMVVLPGMTLEVAPVTKTSLTGIFGWRNLPFQIDKDEEQAVRECKMIAWKYFSTSNGKRVFDQQETRQKLETILEAHPTLFAARHLLGTWHRVNGNQETAERLIRESLADAPVVLTRRYRHGNGSPLIGVEIPGVSIECNRVQNFSRKQIIKLSYVGFITDEQGEIHLPVYDTVNRLSSTRSPVGYNEESIKLGFFESKAHRGILPDVTVWHPWSRPRDFVRTASESRYLQDATGTQSSSLNVDSQEFRIGSVVRAQSDGHFTIEDGKGVGLSAACSDLPMLTNTTFVDHAVIDLAEPAGSRFDIGLAMVLDSQTKIRLQDFQSSAGLKPVGNRRFHLFSFWQTLPETVDLVLDVYPYQKGSFRYVLAPTIGARAAHGLLSVKITHLAAGQHVGWSSIDGFRGEPQAVDTSSEVIIDFSGNATTRASLWVVLKDGRKWNLKTGGWYSVQVGSSPIRIGVPLDGIDHFEILPYIESRTIYFEGIQLPARHGTLEQPAELSVEFAINGKATEFVSEELSPLAITFEAFRGDRYHGHASGRFGYELLEKPRDGWELDTATTVIWHTDVPIKLTHKLELTVQSDNGELSRSNRYGGMRASGEWGQMGSAIGDIPITRVESARLEFVPVSRAE
jgi:beta-lactamase regulating signal transducer with metallopeptidase domain